MSATRILDVVVGCTDRKLRSAPPELRFGNRPIAALTDRVRHWTRTLDTSQAQDSAAEELYAGDHWSVVRSIAMETHADLNVRVWIASGGYGLIGLATPVKAYGATFSQGHADSVAPKSSTYTPAEWWDALTKWRPKGSAGPRSVAELAEEARSSTQSFVLVALSEPYVDALAPDIASARGILPERIGTVSVGGATARHRHGAVSLNLIRADARLKSVVGGAMHSINARVARKVVAEHAQWFPTLSGLQRLVDQWMSEAPPMPVYNRDRQSDDQVRALIVNAIRREPRMTHTRLLRELRDAGQACEQGRFRALFKEVRDASRAPSTNKDQST